MVMILKSSLRSCDAGHINSLRGVFPGLEKNINAAKQLHVDMIANLSFVNMQHCI